MRKLALSFLVAVAGTSFGLACSSPEEDDTEVAADNLTDRELANSALTTMGASQLPQPAGEHPSCAFTGCHSINTVTLRQWNEQYKAAMTMLSSNASNDTKINYFRQNPNDPRTGFTPERVGPLSAGAHLALGANVNQTRHPETYKQGKLLADIFRGKEALYAEFRKEMLMPVLPEYPRLTPTQYETVITWFKKGMPNMADIIREDTRPTSCQDSFADLRARTSQVKNQTWAAKNKANRLPMIGCAAPDPANPVSATKCFEQKKDGKDIFPKAVDGEFSRAWALDGSNVRIMREFSDPNSFWVRTSADGRFIASGGGRNGGAQAMDIKTTLEGGPTAKRDIGLDASYDPDFWPDNKAFMFQGGTKFCAQSLLEKPATTLVNFGEPECSSLSAASGLYQTVGQVVGDNSISDRFILYSIWAGDSGSFTADATDTPARAGEDGAINIYTAVAQGNDVEEGYKINGDAFKIPTPYRGDTMFGRSGSLIGSRWSYAEPAQGQPQQYGYALEKLDRQLVNGKYKFTLSTLGNVCMKGNKANISYDERFLSSHHYNEQSDYSAADRARYAEKGSADVWVVDFITGKKQVVTKMGPGQFALYPHFRSDGWLYFLVADRNTNKYWVAASDWAIRSGEATPTP